MITAFYARKRYSVSVAVTRNPQRLFREGLPASLQPSCNNFSVTLQQKKKKVSNYG